MGVPKHYAGEPEGCGPFLFTLQPSTFTTGAAKRQMAVCSRFHSFSAEFGAPHQKVFDVESGDSQAARRILQLIQGSRSIADYSIDFGTLAVGVGSTLRRFFKSSSRVWQNI